MSRRLPSIRSRILSSIILVLLTLTVILTLAFGIMIGRQARQSLVDQMEIAMQMAWQAYLEGPSRMTGAIQALLGLPSFRVAAMENHAALGTFLDAIPGADFVALVAEDRTLLAHTSPRPVSGPPFPHIVDEALRQATAQFSSELVSVEWIEVHMPGDAGRVNLPPGCSEADPDCFRRGLVQVVAVPFTLPSAERAVVVAGILLNNTPHIPRATSARLPGSYLSVAAQGVRVSTNITTEQGPLSPGGRQADPLLRAVGLGQRYYGTVTVNDEHHYVASDPIYDSSGQVIGALSVGLPPSGFAEITRGNLPLILACALLSLLAAMAFARTIARRLAMPIVALEQDVMRLAAARGSQELKQAAAQMQSAGPILYSQEVLALYRSFQALADSLVKLTEETERNVERIERDRLQLKNLTKQLQEAKADLERKVEERTKELEQVVLELRQANAMKSQFLATMSHELRTPLNSVIGFSEMMADGLVGPLTPKQREYLDHILSSARHLLQLISDILDLSRIEQGRMSLELQTVSLHELIDSVRAKVEPQVSAQGLTLVVETDPDVPVIQADPTRVKEVLYNLLSNAIKFTPAGGKIWMRLRQTDDMAVMEVEDTGIGMRPEDLEAVWGEFVQGESAYHRRFEGVGLGLPISKKLLELHGGRIELESELGRGTLVRCYLPLRRGAEQ